MYSWPPASCLTPSSSHLRGAHAVPALEPQLFPGPASVPCLPPISFHGVNSVKIPTWEACSAAGGEQLVPGLVPSRERLRRGGSGNAGDRGIWGAVVPSLLNTCSWSQSEGGMKGNSLSQLTSRMAPWPSGPQAQLA